MDAAIEPISIEAAQDISIVAVIAEAVALTRLPNANKDDIYEYAKQRINRVNPRPDEYQRAIRLLTEALKI